MVSTAKDRPILCRLYDRQKDRPILYRFKDRQKNRQGIGKIGIGRFFLVKDGHRRSCGEDRHRPIPKNVGIGQPLLKTKDIARIFGLGGLILAEK